jgi:C1A family cysteine protease
LLGGHALIICGYDDASQMFLIANSWGTKIGLVEKRGYFKVPYSVIANRSLCSDFWSPRLFQ